MIDVARLLKQPGEAVGIDRLRVDSQPIALTGGLQDRRLLARVTAWFEDLAKAGDEPLHDGVHRRRRMLAPQVVDDPIHRDRFAGSQDEQREEHAGPAGRQVDVPQPVENLHRSKDPELHRSLLAAESSTSSAFSQPLAAARSMGAKRHGQQGKEPS